MKAEEAVKKSLKLCDYHRLRYNLVYHVSVSIYENVPCLFVCIIHIMAVSCFQIRFATFFVIISLC